MACWYLVVLIHTSESCAGDRRHYQPSQIDWFANGAISNSVAINGALALRIWTCHVMLLEKARECLGREFPISDDELADSVSQFEMLGKLAFELVAAGCYEERG